MLDYQEMTDWLVPRCKGLLFYKERSRRYFLDEGEGPVQRSVGYVWMNFFYPMYRAEGIEFQADIIPMSIVMGRVGKRIERI